MKGLSDLLQLGNPLLYDVSELVHRDEKTKVKGWVADLHQVMLEIRAKYNFGRAIAAPQIGLMKRLIYANINEPKIIINPVITEHSEEMIEVWDDCMCFPHLMVRVMRHKKITVRYLDEFWVNQVWHLSDDLSELIQHEYDHLNGVLCTMRAIDSKSFRWRN